MKHKKLTYLLLGGPYLALMLVLSTISTTHIARATSTTCNDGSVHVNDPNSEYGCPTEGGRKTTNTDDAGTQPITTQAQAQAANPNCNTGTRGLEAVCTSGGNPIYALITLIANWALGLIGLAAVLVIVVAGIQYTTSQGDPAAIKSAKSRIVNAVVGLILLSLMFVILKIIGVST